MVVEHIAEPDSLLEELFRVLWSGASFLFHAPNLSARRSRFPTCYAISSNPGKSASWRPDLICPLRISSVRRAGSIVPKAGSRQSGEMLNLKLRTATSLANEPLQKYA